MMQIDLRIFFKWIGWLDPTQLEPPEPGIGRTKLSQLKGQVFSKAALKKGMTTEELQRIKKLFSNRQSWRTWKDGFWLKRLVLDTSFLDKGWMMDALFCFWWGPPKIVLIPLDVTKNHLVYGGFSCFNGHSWPFWACSSRALSPVLIPIVLFFWSGRLNSTFTVKKQDGHPVGQDVYNIVAIFCLEFPPSASAIQTSSNF